MVNDPALSVIVPTHNRYAAVERLLGALARQEPVEGGFEVIVVADGCVDGTADRLAGGTWPFALRVVEQTQAGPAVARNAGAGLARGATLVFIDDDIEPDPRTLLAHLTFHQTTPRAVGLGSLAPTVAQRGFFAQILRGWLHGMDADRREAGHRFVFRDLLSGHFSIDARTFEQLGGFDTALRCHEDWELGYRALAEGVTFGPVTGAVALNHDCTTLTRSLGRKFDEGMADVDLVRRHPEIAAELPLGRPLGDDSRMMRWLIALAWDRPQLGDAIVKRCTAMLWMYERLSLRFRWRALLERMLTYWYWRGVALAVGRRERLQAAMSVNRSTAEPPLVLDLSSGVDAGASAVERLRPAALRLVYGSEPIADVPARPGAERLRGNHLRRLVGHDLANAYLRAAAAAGGVPAPFTDCVRELMKKTPPPTSADSQASASAA